MIDLYSFSDPYFQYLIVQHFILSLLQFANLWDIFWSADSLLRLTCSIILLNSMLEKVVFAPMDQVPIKHFILVTFTFDCSFLTYQYNTMFILNHFTHWEIIYIIYKLYFIIHTFFIHRFLPRVHSFCQTSWISIYTGLMIKHNRSLFILRFNTCTKKLHRNSYSTLNVQKCNRKQVYQPHT